MLPAGATRSMAVTLENLAGGDAIPDVVDGDVQYEKTGSESDQ